MSLNKEIWKQSKPAREYPKDWIVIPALDVNELIIKRLKKWLVKETKGLNITEDTKHSPIFSFNDIFEMIVEIDKEKIIKD